MADDAEEIKEAKEFHPCDTPHGMNYYILKDLTADQQHQLNLYKCNVIRSNQKYLYEHPEIRAFVSIIMRKVLKDRPSHDVQLFIAKYFTEHWADIRKQMELYVEDRKKMMEKTPQVSSSEESDESSYVESMHSFSLPELPTTIEQETLDIERQEHEMICREILSNILEGLDESETKKRSVDSNDIFDLNKYSISLPDNDFLDFDLDNVGEMFDQFEDIE